MRLRRSLIYMPGTDWRKIEKAALELDADSVCMDLEDGVALQRKEEARPVVVRALQTLDFGRSEKLVRINAVDSPLAEADLAAVLLAHPDGIVIPKAANASQLAWVDEKIRAAENQHGWPQNSIRLLAVVESAQGIVNLAGICQAAPRLDGLIFGAEDFAADIGAARSVEGWEVFYGRSALVTHAAAFGLQAIDMVYIDFNDLEGFTRQAQNGLQMGFTGKQLIHPRQVPLIHQVYTPDGEALAQAQRLVDAFQEHQKAGKGAFALDGKMIDMPLLRAAENVLARAREGKKP